MIYVDIEAPIDDTEWAKRNSYWQSEAIAKLPKRKLRQRSPAPLILNGHGVSLRIENGALVIRDGFTHYPQEQAKYRYFPRDLELPTRILLLDGSGTLSFDVLSWLSEQGVALARAKRPAKLQRWQVAPAMPPTAKKSIGNKPPARTRPKGWRSPLT